MAIYTFPINTFTIKSNSFQKKYNELIITLLFTKVLFVIEVVFIPKQITECRFGALLKISDTFALYYSKTLQGKIYAIFPSKCSK